jgi:hypothetical protein
MTCYVIEHDGSKSRWTVREHETGKQLGTLTRKGIVYTAESTTLRASSQSIDPVLALRSVFRTSVFYSKESTGLLERIAPERLRSILTE